MIFIMLVTMPGMVLRGGMRMPAAASSSLSGFLMLLRVHLRLHIISCEWYPMGVYTGYEERHQGFVPETIEPH